jgi:hypothetical protein
MTKFRIYIIDQNAQSSIFDHRQVIPCVTDGYDFTLKGYSVFLLAINLMLAFVYSVLCDFKEKV